MSYSSRCCSLSQFTLPHSPPPGNTPPQNHQRRPRFIIRSQSLVMVMEHKNKCIGKYSSSNTLSINSARNNYETHSTHTRSKLCRLKKVGAFYLYNRNKTADLQRKYNLLF